MNKLVTLHGHYFAYGVPPVERTKFQYLAKTEKKVNNPDGGQEACQTKSELWKYGHYLAYGVPGVPDGAHVHVHNDYPTIVQESKMTKGQNLGVQEGRKAYLMHDLNAGGPAGSHAFFERTYGQYLARGVPGVLACDDDHLHKIEEDIHISCPSQSAACTLIPGVSKRMSCPPIMPTDQTYASPFWKAMMTRSHSSLEKTDCTDGKKTQTK